MMLGNHAMKKYGVMMMNNYCSRCGQQLDSHLLQGSHSLPMCVHCGNLGYAVDLSDIIKRIYALEQIVLQQDDGGDDE